MYFLEEEQSAIMRISVAMAMADGLDNPNERILNYYAWKKINVTERAAEKAKTMSLPGCMFILSSMSTEKKEFVYAFLCAIMLADGNMDRKEMALLNFVSEGCGFPKINLNEALEKFEKRIGL